eukprot:scaffold452_cov163-Skeletonema_marinoi.AAC.3
MDAFDGDKSSLKRRPVSGRPLLADGHLVRMAPPLEVSQKGSSSSAFVVLHQHTHERLHERNNNGERFQMLLDDVYAVLL